MVLDELERIGVLRYHRARQLAPPARGREKQKDVGTGWRDHAAANLPELYSGLPYSSPPRRGSPAQSGLPGNASVKTGKGRQGAVAAAFGVGVGIGIGIDGGTDCDSDPDSDPDQTSPATSTEGLRPAWPPRCAPNSFRVC